MSYSATLLASPYPWLAASALALGAALQRATRRARPRYLGDDPEKARTSKWLFFSLFLCLAVVAALGAVFVPGPFKLLQPRFLYFYAACAALSFLALRFRKSLGAATLLLLLALAFTAALFLRSLSAFTGETEIGRVRVLAAREGRMELEVTAARGEPVIRPMAGAYFAPVVKVVIFDDLFVFLGAKSWYRLEGFSSFSLQKGDAVPHQETTFTFPEPEGITQRLWEFFERYEKRIPGVRSVQTEMDLKKVRRELTTYSLRLQNDGGLQIVELQ
jgi:hypothetical protein